jgi:uncharacterized protein (TIGR02246 family)
MNVKDELIAREREYLEAVRTKDGRAAAGLTAGETLVVSGRGAMRLGPDDIKKMLEEADTSREYDFVEDSVEIVEVTDDVAIITYMLKTRAGSEESEAFDTDVWVKRDGKWRCALHAEVPADQ